MTHQAQTETQSPLRPRALESISPLLKGVYSCQSGTPGLLAAEQELVLAIATSQSALNPDQKVRLMHAAIRAQGEAGLGLLGHAGAESMLDPVLETFATKFSACPASLSRHDIKRLTESGLSASALVEAVCAVAIARFLLTLARNSEFEFEWRLADPPLENKLPSSKDDSAELPYLEMPSIEHDGLTRSYSILREQYGFVPNLYRIQSYSPEVVTAQVNLLDALLFPEDHLTRIQKELIVLRLAALNVNTSLATMQVNILGLLGIGSEECDQIIDTLHCAPVSPQERVLLEETEKLSLFSMSGR